MKRFKKRGRSLALQGSVGYSGQNKETGIFSPLLSRGVLDTLDQDQLADQSQLDYGGKITWTEPIGRFKFMEFLYAHQENANDLTKDFYNLTPEESVFDSMLSNRYDGGYRYDQAGVNFRYVRKKMNLTLGLAGQRSALKGQLGLQDTTLSKVFLNLLPSLRFNYKIKQGSRIRFSYRTSVNAPSLEQLQPVLDNSNRQNVFIGNPDFESRNGPIPPSFAT